MNSAEYQAWRLIDDYMSYYLLFNYIEWNPKSPLEQVEPVFDEEVGSYFALLGREFSEINTDTFPEFVEYFSATPRLFAAHIYEFCAGIFRNNAPFSWETLFAIFSYVGELTLFCAKKEKYSLIEIATHTMSTFVIIEQLDNITRHGGFKEFMEWSKGLRDDFNDGSK